MALACFLLAASVQATPAEAAQPSQLLPALAAIEQGHWDQADKLARATQDNLIIGITRFLDYTQPDSTASYTEIARFLQDHPGWPLSRTLRRQAEMAMIAEAITDRAEIRRWLGRYSQPITTDGAIYMAEQLAKGGRSDRALANQVIRQLYTENLLTAGDQARIQRRFGDALGEAQHMARFEMLMGRNGYTLASSLLDKLPASRAKPAQVALALARKASNGARQYAALPAAARQDRVLAHHLVRWHRLRDNTDEAIAALNATDQALQKGDDWWRERRILARRKLASEDDAAAYKLAAAHGPLTGALKAEAEALAGWIALNRLNKPADALRHYADMHDAADRASLKSEAAYMAAEAANKLGQTRLARSWLEKAADHPMLWHGQQALTDLKRPFTLPRPAPITAAGRKAFEANDMVQATHLLTALGRADLASPFLIHLADTASSDAERRLVAELAAMAGDTTAAIRAERKANREGGHVGAAGWPIYDLPHKVTSQIGDIALLHGQMRQESGFDMQIASHAGARGLMQLLPGTAKDVARDLNISYSHSKLTSDAGYNMQLGAGYLKQMMDRYGGQPELALAAYNGGPGNVDKWLRAYGDPRSGAITMAHWVELIPFNETRGYVQHVLENRRIYKAIMEAKDGT